LAALPLLAFCGGALVTIAPRKLRSAAAVGMLVAAAFPWIVNPRPDNWVCWKESQLNSEARRAWTHEAAQFLQEQYRHGSGVFTGSGDLMGVFREAGLPFRETLNDGDEPAWMAATRRPDMFLHEQWALTFSGDAVASAVQRPSFKSGPHYELVKSLIVKNAPVIEIYQRHDTPRAPITQSPSTPPKRDNSKQENETDDQ